MMKREAGFSFLELMFVMAIMGFVLAAGAQMFVGLLSGYKQQSKITETNIEGIIGLDLLRRDLESAGYGLPWIIPAGTTYNEASNATAAAYNDSTVNPPRAILNGDGSGAGGSDYLVIKAINIARNDQCTKWEYLSTGGTAMGWNPTSENLSNSDRVIIISPGTPETNGRALVVNGGFSTTFDSVSGFASIDETRIIYGVAPANSDPLRMPFNRADYYISTTASLPGRCASGTGVLMKAVVNQNSTGGFNGNSVPLLDCVADFQVAFKLDRTGNGTQSDAVVLNDLTGTELSAAQIRDQLKEVRVFILAHEGQRDTAYTHPTNPILVGDSVALGRNFDLTTLGDPNWRNYRWKVYTLVIKPNNLR